MKNTKNSFSLNNKGSFIAFEGIDGSGKSTQISLLMEKLCSKKIECYRTCEPTDSPIGSLIHQIMIGRIKTDNKAIAALFVADRLDHLLNDVDGITYKLERGINVISDRYYFSSYAYHGVDMDMEWVINANSVCKQILKPTFNIFIDVDPNEAIKRISNGRDKSELFETYDRLVQVRENYFKAFSRQEHDENIIIIDGNRTQDEISEDIWRKIECAF